MTCTKSILIEKISDTFDQHPSQSKEVVETLIEIMKSTLASGEDIMISGFGKFQVIEKTPRKGRNPATGDAMILKKRRVVTFKCAGKLKNKMNQQETRDYEPV
ncbi:MAG: integration host factor subunit alpha [Desulfobacter postgatei]|uniref:Integration host factor subunit alpha n=1 Tax=Desulfobacter postgatei TaxID=2293 RepID=A0A2G6MTS3_9BACT|nr:MAG: integration host factor subunit alpha [Desulfobacter postgatei]